MPEYEPEYFTRVEQLLPPETLEQLSRAAGALYGWLWNKMNHNERPVVYGRDREVARRSRMEPDVLIKAREELQAHGLLLFEHHSPKGLSEAVHSDTLGIYRIHTEGSP